MFWTHEILNQNQYVHVCVCVSGMLLIASNYARYNIYSLIRKFTFRNVKKHNTFICNSNLYFLCTNIIYGVHAQKCVIRAYKM